MFRLLNLIIILIFVNNCSIDTKTGIWENKEGISTDAELSSLSFDENITFDKSGNRPMSKGPKVVEMSYLLSTKFLPH